VFDGSRETWLHAALRHYGHLVGGMYLNSVLAGLGSLMPSRWLRKLVRARLDPQETESTTIARMAEAQLIDRCLDSVRIDALLILAVGGASAAIYGPRWPIAAGLVLGRALLVSVFDNSYHYGTSLNARADAKNFALPAWACGFLLHTNLHRVHHAFPYLPWRTLPRAAPALARPDAPFVMGVLAQLKGPVPLRRVH
jgi:hypothetical protein